MELQEAENAPETGEVFLMNKVLIKSEKEISELVQRKALFKKSFKEKGKCCKVIIDSGSTKNLVSTEMIGKLNLGKIMHPNPYKVSWLQKGCKYVVNEQSEVDHIGDYKDKVLCDIIPMDVCHVLLGRLWQFDKNATHDGKRNTYVFEMDGKKHTLTPLKPEGTNDKVGEKMLVMKDKEWLKGQEYE